MQKKIVDPVTVLFIRQELTIPEVGMYAERYAVPILELVESQQLEVVGPWIFVSYHLPKNITDRYLVDFCLPVAQACEPCYGRVSCKTLGTFYCATADYHGDLAQLYPAGYDPLIKEIIAAGLPFSGESREVYHAWHNAESAANHIELQFGIQGAPRG